MKEMSRKEFLNVSAICASALLVPELKMPELKNGPLTELPILHAYNTPIKIDFLDARNKRVADIPSEWSTLNNVPIDILTPFTRVRSEDLDIEPYPGMKYALTTKLPHITGSPTEITAVIAWGDDYFYRHLNGSLIGKGGDTISTYAYTDKHRMYANKIWNDLTVYAAIAEWQKKHGPLLPGEEFSFLDMTNIRDRLNTDYKMGMETMAGGVCAAASTLSKAVFLASSRGYTEITKRSLHLAFYQYFTSPLDPEVTKANSDAAVFYQGNPRLKHKDADFKFKVRENSPSPIYLSFSACLNYDDEPKIGMDRRYDADARFTFTATVRKTPPVIDGEAFLLNLRSEYANFHQFAG